MSGVDLSGVTPYSGGGGGGGGGGCCEPDHGGVATIADPMVFQAAGVGGVTVGPGVQRYRGFSMRNNDLAVSCVVEIHDGAVLIERVSLGPGESARELYPLGVGVDSGALTAAPVVGGPDVNIILRYTTEESWFTP